MTLEEALAARVDSLARTKERLHALDDQTDSHIVQEAAADAVLRQALAVLETSGGYDAALRLLRGDDVGPHDELAKSGLAVWDPASDSLRPTSLLVELMKVVNS